MRSEHIQVNARIGNVAKNERSANQADSFYRRDPFLSWYSRDCYFSLTLSLSHSNTHAHSLTLSLTHTLSLPLRQRQFWSLLKNTLLGRRWDERPQLRQLKCLRLLGWGWTLFVSFGTSERDRNFGFRRKTKPLDNRHLSGRDRLRSFGKLDQ